MINECEQLVEWELARETENSAKSTIVPLCPPQIPHDMIRDRTGATTVGTPAANHLIYGTTIYILINSVIRNWTWRMPSSGMWCRVDFVWTDVSEEGIASIFRVENLKSYTAIEHVQWL
jgi:hypothetical protein